jgi:iron complex transport system substrate-binding protein
MSTIKFIAACAIFLLANSAYCQKITVLDDAGTRIELALPAQRIITLAPNLAELVYAAGAGNRLVAATRYSDFPEAVKKLPLVGDAFALNLERIATLKPDVVLVWLSGTPERQRSALKALAKRQGFAVFESEIRNVQGIGSTLQRIGQLAGSQAVANAQASAIDTQWQALSAQYAQAAPVTVFYQVWDAPLMTFNGQHIVSQAIRACGGVQGFDNAAALTPTVSREAVLAFNPQTSPAHPHGPALCASGGAAVPNHRFGQTPALALPQRASMRFIQARNVRKC